MSHWLPAIEPWAELWSANLWQASWEGAIALTLAWAIARTCTFLPPRVVCWIWRLACIKILVAFVWSAPIEIGLLPAEPGALVPVTAPVTVAAMTQRLETDLAVAVRAVPVRSASWGAIELLFVVWIAGVALRAAITFRQWADVRRLCRAAALAENEVLNRICREEAARLGVRRLPELRLSSCAVGPQLTGIFRPRMIFPFRAVELLEPTELRLVLAHELAHLKRRDLAWNWLPTAIGCLFFFHPLVWLLGRYWSAAQEAACDELVIQDRVARLCDYGRLLVKLSTHWPQPFGGLATAGVLGTFQSLEGRIMAMTRIDSFSPARLVFAAGALAAVALVGVVPWQLVAQEPKPQAATAAEERQSDAVARHDAIRQFKLLALAMHIYHDTYKSFPPPALLDAIGKPTLSWRVAILPYIERSEADYAPLYAKFHLDEPWDSEHNEKLIAEMPKTYKCPNSKSAADGRTVYLVPHGDSTVFPDSGGVSLRDIKDGTSSTLFLVEVDEDHAVPWTQPDDWDFKPAEPSRGLGGHFLPKGKCFLVAGSDGAVHMLKKDVAKTTLRAWFTRAGGEFADFEHPADLVPLENP